MKLKKLFKLLILVSFIFIWGCATVGIKPRKLEKISLIEISNFCKKNKLDYKYLPFYEEIILSNNFLNIKLKPQYSYALINNIPKNLYRDVEYKRGEIFIPSTLQPILESFKKKAPKGLASLIPAKIETIVIDPGHGGRDPGAISPWGLKEKEVNLKIAKYLYNFLKKRGFRVYLTRKGDYFVSLKDRVRFARKRRADLFISIHANSNRSRRLKGLEVYYLSSKFSDTQSRILATTENLVQNGEINLPAGLKNINIIGEMVQRRNKRETMEFSSLLLKSANDMGIYTRKSIGAPFYVLKHNLCPSVLIEVGYLTNRDEERLLRTLLYKKQLALAIAEGILRLRDSLKKRLIVRSE